MAKIVLPRVQAMVLCDALKESDDEADVFSFSGVRSFFVAASFPALRPRLCVFLQMSGHEGEASLHVEVNQIAEDEVIYRTPSKTVSFKSPSHVVPVAFRVRNCVFASPGVYYVQVFNERKLIGERPLYVHQEE